MWFRKTLQIATEGRGTIELTGQVSQLVDSSGIGSGICHVFNQHTSASLMLCENADPAVRHDLETFMGDLVLDGDPRFVHTQEGADDMPAHIRSILTTNDLSIPVEHERLMLGTWQGVYLWEHRTRPHRRQIIVTVMGN